MEIRVINVKLTNEEKETLLNYDYIEKKWYMDTTILKHYNKAKRQGWQQIIEYRYDDDTVCGGLFVGPARAITIRSVDKKQMSEKQLSNLINDEED